MKARVFLAIWLVGLAVSGSGVSFVREAGSVEELKKRGIPMSRQAMELTADLIRSLVVELSDESGQPLGIGSLATFYELRSTKNEDGSTVTYVFLPEAALGTAARVTVTSHTPDHVAPLSLDLLRSGEGRNVFLGGAEHGGLVAIRLPPSHGVTGVALNALSRPGKEFTLRSGMTVWFPRSGNAAKKKGTVVVRGVEQAVLLHARAEGQDVWAASAPWLAGAAGTPLFVVDDKETGYGRMGGRYWLGPYPLEWAGMLELSVTLNAPPPAGPERAPKPGAASPDRPPGEAPPAEDALETKYFPNVSGVISRPVIVAAAKVLYRQVVDSGWVFTDDAPPKSVLPPPEALAAREEEAPLGMVTMDQAGTLILSLWKDGPDWLAGDGDGPLCIASSAPDYRKILAHLPQLQRGETVPIFRWITPSPRRPSGGRSSRDFRPPVLRR